MVFPVSRLVVDPERFEKDDEEPMAARGMGVVYELTSHGQPLRVFPSSSAAEERGKLLERFYRPTIPNEIEFLEVGHGSCSNATLGNSELILESCYAPYSQNQAMQSPKSFVFCIFPLLPSG